MVITSNRGDCVWSTSDPVYRMELDSPMKTVIECSTLFMSGCMKEDPGVNYIGGTQDLVIIEGTHCKSLCLT